MNDRLTHRGYHWHADELAIFQAFKADGAIAQQAQPEHYAIDFDSHLNARLWYRTRYNASGHAMEMQIACMPRRYALYIHDDGRR